MLCYAITDFVFDHVSNLVACGFHSVNSIRRLHMLTKA